VLDAVIELSKKSILDDLFPSFLAFSASRGLSETKLQKMLASFSIPVKGAKRTFLWVSQSGN